MAKTLKPPVVLFKNRVGVWADKIGVKPERVSIQAMRNKWASCSTTGRVYFSRDLLNQGAAFQDSVIAHELLHLLVPNHGALFKSLLMAYLPQAKGFSAPPQASAKDRPLKSSLRTEQSPIEEPRPPD